ncbi:ABC transporter ATP-binding protein [Bradyrhizobium sp. 83002]|uniref:ABC transporter ATP-binding protein n=1 Tax=Bradyrhizobium aeschynomenes TaxID=2734909 RepID=UPI0015556A7D|nr:ATP-binding cassette domain-containing protein [Bradyrhizobium aeschynomenes]NPU13442.1 ABC transporter ATP-binding protein [Bradyrhizobium aeschynomenes]
MATSASLRAFATPRTVSAPLPPDPVLKVRALTVQFKEFVALNEVSLDLRNGCIHAVIGPNGAGKSTLFNAISGFIKPIRGQIELFGRDVTAWPANRLARLGLARSFQICAIFPELSVEENMLVAQAHASPPLRLLRRRVSGDLAPHSETLLARAGLTSDRRRQARELSYGRRRLLEIATTLALKPRLLLLDEPTSGLGREDIAPVVEMIADAARDCCVLLVEHNLKVVERLADHVTVLANGSVLSDGSYQEVARDHRVRAAYLGAATDA